MTDYINIYRNAFIVSIETRHAPGARVPTRQPIPKISRFSGSDHLVPGAVSFSKMKLLIVLPLINLLAYFSVSSVDICLLVKFSKYLRKGLIEFPWAEIATFTFSFFIFFIISLIKGRTLFSTIFTDSPPGGGIS